MKTREANTTISVGTANPDDLPAVHALVQGGGLPLEGLDEHITETIVSRLAPGAAGESTGRDSIVATATLELYGDAALLRSVAVDEGMRGRGLGHAITRAALDLARERGVRDVYLLTETAGDFFPRFGFEKTTRAGVPESVLQSIEFTTLCPESSLVMVKRV